MWRRRPWRLYPGLSPIGLHLHRFRPLPSESDYPEMLDRYKNVLEGGLTIVAIGLRANRGIRPGIGEHLSYERLNA